MHFFAGVLNLPPNGPPSRKEIQSIDMAFSFWGDHAEGQWHGDQISLMARARKPAPHRRSNGQPIVLENLALVGFIRLDNRGELTRELGLEFDSSSAMTDSYLMALAWTQWGTALVDHIEGDWVCAIWDRINRTLWLGRDAAGNTGLYWWEGDQKIIFSNSLKALLAHPAVPQRPNAYTIARQLAVVMDYRENTASHFEEIKQLPGGFALRSHAWGMQLEKWWCPENLPEYRWASDAEGYEAFRAVYGTAVEQKLRRDGGPVALMMSAGLDSSSVAAIAAPMLKAEQSALLGYIAVPRFAPHGAPSRRSGDEGPLAKAAAKHIGNMELIPTQSDAIGIVESIQRMVDLHDRPGHAAANQYWIQDILSLAAQRGAEVLLTGQGGNATVSWTGMPLRWSDLYNGGMPEFYRALTGSKWSLVKHGLLKLALRPALTALRRIKQRGHRPWSAYSAISLCLEEETDLYHRMRQAGHDPAFIAPADTRHPRIAHFRLGHLGSASLGATWMELGAAYGLDVRDPTRDRRMIEFCWRTPNHLFWASGRQRGLIRMGMHHSLPQEIMLARRKGLQAADLGYRLLAERGAVLDALASIERHPLAGMWLDVGKMRETLHDLEQAVNADTTARAGSILARGMGVGFFLMRF